jgi:hypothetical protein
MDGSGVRLFSNQNSLFFQVFTIMVIGYVRRYEVVEMRNAAALL